MRNDSLTTAGYVLCAVICFGIALGGGCADQGMNPEPAGGPPVLTSLPEISSISSDRGAPGDVVTISGFRFGTGGGSLSFNRAAAQISVWTEVRITATVPEGATTGPVIVHAGHGSSNGVPFTIEAPAGPRPSISDVSPNPANVGDRLRIHGTNFGAETPEVTFNGVPGTVDEWRTDEIRVYVPAGAVTGPLVVRCGGRSSVPYSLVVNGTTGGLSVSNANVSVSEGSSATVQVSGGTPAYALVTEPNGAVASAAISGTTITITGRGQGQTSTVVRDQSTPEPFTVTIMIHVSSAGGGMSFSRDIQPIFDANCTGCHGGSAGLYLTPAQSYGDLVNVPAQAGCTTEMRVLPGSASTSVLWRRISGNSCGERMPRGGNPLSSAEIQKIADWINQGAMNN